VSHLPGFRLTLAAHGSGADRAGDGRAGRLPRTSPPPDPVTTRDGARA
jgi:hypothetical protein